eukprot:7632197-Pyramimonas_sp.AAC.1
MCAVGAPRTERAEQHGLGRARSTALALAEEAQDVEQRGRGSSGGKKKQTQLIVDSTGNMGQYGKWGGRQRPRKYG